MAVSATHKTVGGSVSTATSYATASVTPSALKLIVLMVYNNVASGTPNTPTVSGNGITWAQWSTGVFTNGTSRGSVFTAYSISAPSTGVITIDCAGQSQNRCNWSLAEFDGANVLGLNGTAGIVQSGIQQGASLGSTTVTLGAFTSVNNATYGFCRTNQTSAITPGTGFTELGEDDSTTATQHQFLASNDTTVDWTDGGTATMYGIAVEVAASLGLRQLASLGVG